MGYRENGETFRLTCTIVPLIFLHRGLASRHSIANSNGCVFVDFPRGKRRNGIDCLRPRRKCLSQREASHSRRVSRIEFSILEQVGFQMRLTNRKWRAGRRAECTGNRPWNAPVDFSRSRESTAFFFPCAPIKPIGC